MHGGHASGNQFRPGERGQGTEVRMTFRYSRDGDPAQERPVQGGVGKDGRWDPEAARGTTTP